jgi:integrase
MRRHGFKPSALGSVRAEAERRVAVFAKEWESIKSMEHEPALAPKGDFKWLIQKFRMDPTWYGAKAPRTQDEMDYVFGIISPVIGEFLVKNLARRHGRGFYNKLREEGASAHKAKKVMKWFVRLMRFAQEIGVRDDNPLLDMVLEVPRGRTQVWKKEQLDQILTVMKSGGKVASGNEFPPRPSMALATMIAYDTSLPQQDILALTWDQYDGEGLSVNQIKERGGREIWVPLSEETLDYMKQMTPVASTHIIVSEENGQPYLDESKEINRSRSRIFSRLFRKFRARAGIEEQLTFQDLRRTALTEMGNSGATNAEIVSFSGHSMNSRVLDVYVKPDHTAAKRGAKKRKQGRK